MTFLTEVHKLLKLYLTIASSERNFLALKHIKTYLRNSMTQQCLNHCMVFHIHKIERMPSTEIALLKNLLKQMRGGLLSSDIFNTWTILKFTYML